MISCPGGGLRAGAGAGAGVLHQVKPVRGDKKRVALTVFLSTGASRARQQEIERLALISNIASGL